LVGVWEQVATEYNQAHEDKDETLATLAKTLKAFFACHSTEDDQHKTCAQPMINFILFLVDHPLNSFQGFACGRPFDVKLQSIALWLLSIHGFFGLLLFQRVA
jgi:hypothetical protein